MSSSGRLKAIFMSYGIWHDGAVLPTSFPHLHIIWLTLPNIINFNGYKEEERKNNSRGWWSKKLQYQRSLWINFAALTALLVRSSLMLMRAMVNRLARMFSALPLMLAAELWSWKVAARLILPSRYWRTNQKRTLREFWLPRLRACMLWRGKTICWPRRCVTLCGRWLTLKIRCAKIKPSHRPSSTFFVSNTATSRPTTGQSTWRNLNLGAPAISELSKCHASKVLRIVTFAATSQMMRTTWANNHHSQSSHHFNQQLVRQS